MRLPCSTRSEWLASKGALVKTDGFPHTMHMLKSPKRGATGAEFVKWFRPLIECLHELGAAKPGEAADWIAEKESVPPAAREVLNKNGGERFVNQVCFARQYLLWEGLTAC